MELERRWEVNKNNVPKDSIKKVYHIEQVYSNLDPDVRIRSKNTKDKKDYEYTHTVKYFISNNDREELEQNISAQQYKRIFDYIDKKPIKKNRYLSLNENSRDFSHEMNR